MFNEGSDPEEENEQDHLTVADSSSSKEDSARKPLLEVVQEGEPLRKALRAVEGSPSLTQAQKAILKKVTDMEFIDNGYPKITRSPAERRFLELTGLEKKAEKVVGRFHSDADFKCVFCDNSVDSEGDDELILCFGMMNGGVRKVSCTSKFHKRCAIMYNSNDFLFQYAARPECQNQLLCPLHCCAACNVDHKKQSAYIGSMTECVLCLRSFHTDSCVPAGSRPLLVDMEVGGKVTTVNMMICPAHATSSKLSVHIKSCRDCHKMKKLVKCTTCIRSFHVKCHEVVKINGKENPMDRCESCLCQDVIRYNVPVVAKWDKGWWLAITRDWHHYPAGKRASSPRFLTVGQTVVEWPTTKGDDGKPLTSILAVSELAELMPSYIRPPMARSTIDQDYWTKVLEDFNPFERIPTVLKEVSRMIPTSKSYKRFTYRLPGSGLCICSGDKRCTTEDCFYVAFECECPPECSQEGRICHNRRISGRKQNPNIQYRVAGKKGYGLFASAPIKRGDFIAEYVGEVIDNAEKVKRTRVIEIARDTQANHYMLKTLDNMTIDAAVSGNLARYINHSCDPNAIAISRRIFVKYGTDDNSLYETRSFIETIRDIGRDEEITFNYRMDDDDSLPPCACGAENCTGTISVNCQKQEPEVVEEEDSSDEEDVPKLGELEEKPKKVIKRRQTHIGVSGDNGELGQAVRKSARRSMMLRIDKEEENNSAEQPELSKWKYVEIFTDRKPKSGRSAESLKRLEHIRQLHSRSAMDSWMHEYYQEFNLKLPQFFVVKDEETCMNTILESAESQGLDDSDSRDEKKIDIDDRGPSTSGPLVLPRSPQE